MISIALLGFGCVGSGTAEVLTENKKLIEKNAVIELYGDRLEVVLGGEKTVWRFEDTTAITVLGKNKLNVYIDDEIFQFKGDKRFNALKYVHIYHRYKNVSKGDQDGKFLGL